MHLLCVRDVNSQSLQLLLDGDLCTSPGVVLERLEDLDARIAALTERRDRALRARDEYVQQAEALLAAASVAS